MEPVAGENEGGEHRQRGDGPWDPSVKAPVVAEDDLLEERQRGEVELTEAPVEAGVGQVDADHHLRQRVAAPAMAHVRCRSRCPSSCCCRGSSPAATSPAMVSFAGWISTRGGQLAGTVDAHLHRRRRRAGRGAGMAGTRPELLALASPCL